MRGALFCCTFLAACGDLPCGPLDLPTAGIAARIDGSDWEGAEASWTMAGSAAQIVHPTTDGWRFTLVAQSAQDGQDLEVALLEGDPVEVPLGDAGFAALYDEAGSSWAGNTEGAGELTLQLDGTQLLGCFSFTGTGADGSVVTVEKGAVRALCTTEGGCI
jgi:hypothetical protein